MIKKTQGGKAGSSKRNRHRLTLPAAVIMALVVQGVAVAEPPLPCAPGSQAATVHGKIKNNAIAASETLGVVSLKILDTRQKLKCGLHGVATADGLGFTHTLVCDDEILVGPGTNLHSQVTLNTRFIAPPAFQSCGASGLVYGAFQEISDPIPGTGRGIFAITGGGRLYVDGTINCAAAIDMKFYGTICMSQ